MTARQHNNTSNLSTAKDSLTHHITLKYIIPKDKLKFRQSYYLRSYRISPQLLSRPGITKFSTCIFEVVDHFYKIICSTQMYNIINSKSQMINLRKNLIFCIYSCMCTQYKIFLLLTNFGQILIIIRYIFGLCLILLVFLMLNGINISVASDSFNIWAKVKATAVPVLN